MAIQPIERIDYTLANLDPSMASTPYTPSWWTNWTVDGIPESSVPWMLAQGWKITSTTPDTSTTPPTMYYSMSRQAMQNWVILQTLMAQMTQAYNEGRQKNALRYDDVVSMWCQAIAKTSDQLDEAGQSHDNYLTAYVANLANLMSAIDLRITECLGAAETAQGAITSQLQVLLTKLDNLENDYVAHVAAIETIIATEADTLTAYLADHLAAMDQLETDFATHLTEVRGIESKAQNQAIVVVQSLQSQIAVMTNAYNQHAADIGTVMTDAESRLTSHEQDVAALLDSLADDYQSFAGSINGLIGDADQAFGDYKGDYNTLLGLLVSDYVTHATVSTTFLVNLGATELARINEQFNEALAEAKQELMSRGLYVSAIITRAIARVERERNEAITQLNDRLAREKLENEHHLFEQQSAMRSKVMEGKDKLYSLDHEMIRYKTEQINALYGQLQEVRKMTLSADSSLYGLRQQLTQYMTETKNGLWTKAQDVRSRTLDNTEKTYQIQDALQKWLADNSYKLEGELLDIRSKILDGIQRRNDTQQGSERNEVEQREKLFADMHSLTDSLVNGRREYATTALQTSQFLAEVMEKMCVQKMQVNLEQIKGNTEMQDREQSLLKYQLDARNNLLIGLWGFMEKRTDSYPDLDKIAQLAFQLGDSGSTQMVGT